MDPTSGAPTPTSSSSSSSTSRAPTPTQEEIEAILKAANSTRPAVPLGIPPPTAAAPPQREKEIVDERCWIRGRQSNVRRCIFVPFFIHPLIARIVLTCSRLERTILRRALGKEPTTTAWCYISLRKQISQMKPVPGVPGAFMGHNLPIPSPSSSPSSSSTEPDPIPSYHWPFLDGRYIYRAKGREFVVNHLKEMGGEEWKGIEKVGERCEKDRERREERGYKEERRMKRAMGLEVVDDYESLTSLSQLYSTSLRRFHTHLIRIYSPGYHQLLRLPSTFTDGTQSRTLNNVWTKLTDGSAGVLAERMWESTKVVVGRVRERRGGGGGGEGGEGGVGGIPPIGGLGGGPPPVAPPP